MDRVCARNLDPYNTCTLYFNPQPYTVNIIEPRNHTKPEGDGAELS